MLHTVGIRAIAGALLVSACACSQAEWPIDCLQGLGFTEDKHIVQSWTPLDAHMPPIRRASLRTMLRAWQGSPPMQMRAIDKPLDENAASQEKDPSLRCRAWHDQHHGHLAVRQINQY